MPLSQHTFQRLRAAALKQVPQRDTAFYLYDVQGLRQRAQLVKSKLAPMQVFYAIKANSNPNILKALAAEGLGADVVSGFELQQALQCDFAPEKIIFSGVGKSTHELKLAMQHNILQINIESLPELERVIKLAADAKNKVRIGVRVNPDIEVSTHPHITTGRSEDKFGVHLGELPQVHTLLKNQNSAYSGVQWQGLSVHVGSQIFDPSIFLQSAQSLLKVRHTFKAQGHPLQNLDIGGGWGMAYTLPQEVAPQEAMPQDQANFEHEHQKLVQQDEHLIQQIAHTLQPLLKNEPDLIWQCEPGRIVVGRFGWLLSRVEYVKRTAHKNFIILNTGMHHFMRTALYGAQHRMYVLPLREGAMSDKSELYDVVGPICESTDTFARDLRLPQLQQNDWVAICDTGAYGFVMANNYNGYPLPDEVLI